MTGATAVIRFRALRSKKRAPDPSVTLKKPSNLEGQREALKAVRESSDRNQKVAGQAGAVAQVAARLAEIRKRNHFADGIRAALGGDDT